MGYSQRRRLEEHLAREVGLALALLGAVLLQVGLPARPLDIAPNLLLLLVICRALLSGPSVAARWAFYVGLSLDLCSGSLLGMHALALLAAVLVTMGGLARLSRSNWLMPLVGVIAGTLAYHTVLAAMISLTAEVIEPRSYIVIAVLPDMLATLIPALPVFLLMRWIDERQRGEVPIDVY